MDPVRQNPIWLEEISPGLGRANYMAMMLTNQTRHNQDKHKKPKQINLKIQTNSGLVNSGQEMDRIYSTQYSLSPDSHTLGV